MEYTPVQLAEKRRKLALEYRDKMEELAEIKKEKAIEIIKLLNIHKTASKAELYWKATDKGQKEIELEFTTKAMIELMRSVKTECDLKNAEAYGQY